MMGDWRPVTGGWLLGIAKNFFNQQDGLHRLSLDTGDVVVIKSECKLWFYGFKRDNFREEGVFPKTYIAIVEGQRLIEGERELYKVKRSKIVEEITIVLKEWRAYFRQFYLNDREHFSKIKEKMMSLIKLRQQLLSGNLPIDETRELQLKATAEIDTGNQLLNLDMVVRDESGEVIDFENISTTQLYELHCKAASRIRQNIRQFQPNRMSKPINTVTHNLLVTLDRFTGSFGDDIELLFTIYTVGSDGAITENFYVKMNFASKSTHQEDVKMLFTDLSNEDLFNSRIYLVAYLVRVGALETKPPSTGMGILIHRNSMASLSSVSINDALRRPYGVAFLDLTPLVRNPDEFSSNKEMNFVSCEKECLDLFLKRQLKEPRDLPAADKQIEVSVEVLHGDINKIKEDLKHVFSNDKFCARKMGFPEVILPDDADDRNDLYLSLMSGKLSKSCKFGEDNIEVHVSVCNNAGEVVDGVITKGGGANLCSEYRSIIYLHEKEPKWHETFKIHLPFHEFENCHVKFLFRHRSSSESKDKGNKPFAMAFLKLMNEDGTALQEGDHYLTVYKIDKKIDDSARFNYFKLPSLIKAIAANDKPSQPGYTYTNKDCFIVKSNLCSIKLTQDIKLLSLLNWNPEQLDQSLKNLLTVDPAEVVKFLRDILDVLFVVLCNEQKASETTERTENLIFDCIIKLIKTVSNPKYKLFESVLDVYINEKFSAPLAYKKLTHLFYRRILNALNQNTVVVVAGEDHLYEMIKHMTYVIRFIIKSRILYLRMNGDRNQEGFNNSIEGLLCSFNQLIASDKDILKAKGAILKYLPIVASDLIQVYDPIKVCHRVVAIVKNIPPGKLSQSKMTCIKDLVESQLFRLPKCREELLPVFCAQIVDYLKSNEESVAQTIRHHQQNINKLAKLTGVSESELLISRPTNFTDKMQECINILNNMLKNLSRNDIGSVETDIKEIMNSLLRTIIQSVIVMNEDNPLRGNLVAIMLGIFHHMRSDHYRSYVQSMPAQIDRLDFLTEILMVFKTLVSNPVFPADWMDMIMHQNTVILESLRQFSVIIMEYFYNRNNDNDQMFEKAVWSKFFYCATEFLVQPALQIDTFTSNKRSLIMKRYRDIRQLTAVEVRRMWFNLSSHKIQFIPELVESFLRMSMLPDEGIRRATIPIFFDMMLSEYFSSRFVPESFGDTRRNPSHCKANFNDFGREMIKKLDYLIQQGEGDDEYRRLFHEIMMNSCRQHTNLSEDGVCFVNKANVLMKKLFEYRNVINDQSKENLMACTYHLLEFYAEREHIDMHTSYLERLYQLQKQNDNYIEAAYTQKRFTDLLTWQDIKLEEYHRNILDRLRKEDKLKIDLNATHRMLKQTLYMQIIDLFDRGKMWELALKVCKELANQFENETYDYRALSTIHDKMSEFYRKILVEARLEQTYYRVGFYGLGFPELLCNKQFIYRAAECERLESFTSRLQNQHPQAEIMKDLSEPSDEIKKSYIQLIQVVAVKPLPNNFVKDLQDKYVNSAITHFHKYNNVKVFELRRPVMLEGFSRDNIAGLCIERTLMETSYPLPGILRSAPIDTVENIRLSPIENAVETMERTNKELLEMIVEYSGDSKLPTNPLTLKLNGIIDAAVMGGFKKYEEAFLGDDYIEQHANDYQRTAELKEKIAEQIPLLEKLLHIHKEKVADESRALHLKIEEKFGEMRTDIEAKYGKRHSDAFLDNMVVLRRPLGTQAIVNGSANRQSDTSVGSADSDKTKSSSLLASIINFPTNTTRRKEKKRLRSSGTRETVWHLENVELASPVSPSTPPINGNNTSSSSGRIELTEQLTPKRPLRSERLSRPPSTLTNSVPEGSTDSLDTINTDDSVPPPLPAKHSSTDFSSARTSTSSSSIDNFTYTTVQLRNTPVTPDSKKAPPTPPPKPARNSKSQTPTKEQAL